jgi:DNA-directed RNA polymerase specialized sigma24 family protein
LAIPAFCDDDDYLLEQILLGDDDAIAALYDRYAKAAYSIALRILRDPALAEGIVCDLFLALWRDPRPVLQIRGSLSPTLVMLARHRAVASLLQKASTKPESMAALHLPNQQDERTTPEGARAALEQMTRERRRMLEKAFFPFVEGAAATNDGSANSPIRTPAPWTSHEVASQLAGTGLDVIDLQTDPAFARRRLHLRDVASHLEGVTRLVHVFTGNIDNILQQLVSIAVDLCGADSAGISIEQKDSPDEQFYRWAATAGQYSGFANAKLPRYPSACGLTLERGRPQIFRVSQRFFDQMGVKAPTVTDGILLPWQAVGIRGTIWIMAHGRDEAFDTEDCRMMQVLAGFAATGVRLQQHHSVLVDQARAASAAAMANQLAHQIHDPLQELMQTVFLFEQGGSESAGFGKQAMGQLLKLSELARRLPSVP